MCLWEQDRADTSLEVQIRFHLLILLSFYRMNTMSALFKLSMFIRVRKDVVIIKSSNSKQAEYFEAYQFLHNHLKVKLAAVFLCIAALS